MTDRDTALRADIARASSALALLVQRYSAPDGPLSAIEPAEWRGRRVSIVGLGSSRFAALDGGAALRAAGIPATVAYASDVPEAPAADLVVVVISASGETREVVDVARRHQGTSLVVAITNGPESTLAGAANVVLPLMAGEESAGISTLTYRAKAAVLGWLADRLGGRPFERVDIWDVVDHLEAIGEEDDWDPTEAADLLDGAPAIDVLAPGSRMGAASQAALMLREAPRLPAHAYETADWLHTGVYLALPGHRVLLFPGSASDAEVVDVVRRRGGEVVAIGDEVPGAGVQIVVPVTRPAYQDLVGSALIDRLAAELWTRASASG